MIDWLINDHTDTDPNHNNNHHNTPLPLHPTPDLYVMKRAVEVYQKYIVERFTAQTTDYQALLQVGGGV